MIKIDIPPEKLKEITEKNYGNYLHEVTKIIHAEEDRQEYRVKVMIQTFLDDKGNVFFMREV